MLRFFLRLDNRKKTPKAIKASVTNAAASPIPDFALVERPDFDFGLGVGDGVPIGELDDELNNDADEEDGDGEVV
jgi:hypothetical protein